MTITLSPDNIALLTDRIEADLRWHGTDAEVPGEQYADALVAAVSFAF